MMGPEMKAGPSGRILSLDAMRGLIMILMAVDHASYFIGKNHPGEFWGVALPVYANAFAFFLRWVTHLCAPGFFFLMGAGMVLLLESRRQAGWTDAGATRFFVTRGALLIVFQLFVENLAWMIGGMSESFQSTEPPGGGSDVMLHFGVLYGLGASMIVWSFLLRLGSAGIAAVSVLCMAAAQLLIPGAGRAGELFAPWVRLLLVPGHTNLWQSFYPLIPWMGIAGLGILFGRALTGDRKKAFRASLYAGILFLVFFVIVRAAGGFGNFHAPEEGWISFLNVTKYPPSLSFILLTLGIDLVLLFLFSGMEEGLQRSGKPLLVFGRSALFFYIVHLYLYLILGFLFPGGASRPVMVFFWLIGLGILYPLCLWYGRFKRKQPVDSVFRFF